MSDIVLPVLLIISIAIAISQFGVIIYFLNFIKKNELHDGAVKEAQTKSAAVILDAVEKANDVVAKAEEAELEKISQSGRTIETLTGNVKASLETIAKTTKEELRETSDTVQKTLEEQAKQAEATLERFLTEDRQLLEQKTNRAIEESSSVFQRFMGDIATQIRKEIDEEIRKANVAVDAYKQERIAAINTKIIDILEEVLLRTLGKKLSLKDEGEFVFQALEQAKKEHAFG